MTSRSIGTEIHGWQMRTVRGMKSFHQDTVGRNTETPPWVSAGANCDVPSPGLMCPFGDKATWIASADTAVVHVAQRMTVDVALLSTLTNDSPTAYSASASMRLSTGCTPQ